MIYVVYSIHIVTSLFLIMVVLLQQGKGADLSVFGGGATQAAFGMRGAATLLHKLTVGCFVLFIVTTISIGILQKGGGSSSIMLDVDSGEVGDVDTEAVEAAATPDADEPAVDAPEDGVAETTEESQN